MPLSSNLGPYDYTSTATLTASDTAQNLLADYPDAIQRVPSGGGRETAQYLLVQVLDADLLWTLTSTPVQGGLGYKAPSGSVISFFGRDAVAAFSFLNFTNGDDARLIITVGF
jgi:hypothetical protein